MPEQLAKWESEAIRLSDAVEAEIREAARNAAEYRPQRCGHSSSPMCCPFENFPTLAAWFTECERERWVERLSPLCDDEWMRRRDRAMELPGAKGHRWERRASSAWERAANSVRSVLNDLADYEDEYAERHAAYLDWLTAGRDIPTPDPARAVCRDETTTTAEEATNA